MINWNKVEEGYTLSKIRQIQIEKQKQEIERLHSIIKEVREYCMKFENWEDDCVNEIMKILDKENKE